MITAIVAIGVFGLLVIFHEMGHFLVAKAAGIKVLEFAIGMGPKIFQYSGKETTYSLRVLPIGGYVKMEGEDEASSDHRSFNNKPILARMAVLFAGSFMNFVLAILLFIILFYMAGAPTTTIDRVIENQPAMMMGMEAGDKIIEINNVEVESWNQLVSIINESKGETLDITFLRNGSILEKSVTPIVNEETGQVMIGIYPRYEKSLGFAIESSYQNTKMIIREIFGFLRRLLGRKASSADLVGPVGIISMVGEATRAGWLNVLFLAGLISINLGIMNLLPIPALDGSRILFLFVELLRGKPVDPEKEGMIHMVGFALLLLLMVFVAYQDILRIFN